MMFVTVLISDSTTTCAYAATYTAHRQKLIYKN